MMFSVPCSYMVMVTVSLHTCSFGFPLAVSLSCCWMFHLAVDPGYVPGMHLPDQMNLERRVNFNELISPSSGTVDTTNVSLYEALKSVIEWTGQVVNGLQTIQWQLLGYETKADGQPDHERPLYSMSNPNPVVNSIVRRYATDTMANLHVSHEYLVDCD